MPLFKPLIRFHRLMHFQQSLCQHIVLAWAFMALQLINSAISGVFLDWAFMIAAGLKWGLDAADDWLNLGDCLLMIGWVLLYSGWFTNYFELPTLTMWLLISTVVCGHVTRETNRWLTYYRNVKTSDVYWLLCSAIQVICCLEWCNSLDKDLRKKKKQQLITESARR